MAWQNLKMIDKLYRIFVATFLIWIVAYFAIYFLSGLNYVSDKPEVQEVKGFAEEYLNDTLTASQFEYTSENFCKSKKQINGKYPYKDYGGFEYDLGIMKMLSYKITCIKIEPVHFWEVQGWDPIKNKMEREGEIKGTMADVYFKTKIYLPAGWLSFKQHHFLMFVLAPAIPHGNNTYTTNLFKLTLYKPESESRWYVYRTFEFRKGTIIERPE